MVSETTILILNYYFFSFWALLIAFTVWFLVLRHYHKTPLVYEEDEIYD